MSGNADNGSDLAEGIFGVQVYEAPAPSKKNFLPWHKPRKQYVREEQWCSQITKLIEDAAKVSLDEGALTYCGLPGSDLLDVRCFHDAICAPRKKKLRFLGFNSGVEPNSPEQLEQNISRDEIAKLDFIDPLSEVIDDDIRSVADTDSMAWAKMAKFGPFDVVNLDLCDSFGTEAGGLFGDNYYNAVSQILAVQARQKTSWLLFLTTRVGKKHVHSNTLKAFRERYSKNLKECQPFKNASAATFKIPDEEALSTALTTDSGLHSVFLTGICKWLLGMALGHQTSVEVASVLGYRVLKAAPTTDIVSLAIRFTPHPVPAKDPQKLAKTNIQLPNECALSVDLIKRVAEHVDVDGLLSDNKALLDDVTARMAGLLELARYDGVEYLDWAMSH